MHYQCCLMFAAVMLLLYSNVDGDGHHEGLPILIQVWTSNDTKADTRAGIYLQIMMDKGVSNYTKLTKHARGYQEFHLTVERMGVVLGFVLGVLESPFNDGWKLDSATLMSIEEKRSIGCFVGNWTGPYMNPPEFRWPLGCVQWEPWPKGVYKWHFVRWSRAVRYNDDRTPRGQHGGTLRDDHGFAVPDNYVAVKSISAHVHDGDDGVPKLLKDVDEVMGYSERPPRHVTDNGDAG